MALKKDQMEAARQRVRKIAIDVRMKTFSVRMDERDIQALTAHFRDQGLPLTTGIRTVLKAYLEGL